METGTIKFFTHRGYGFIRPSRGDQDIFFHVSELPLEKRWHPLDEGTPVSYELGMRHGRRVARNIAVLGGAE